MKRCAGSWVLGLVMALWSQPATAQTEGLIRWLRITSLQSYLELGYELEIQNRKSPNSDRSFGQDEGTFTFGLNADLSGSFLNPVWLPFTLGGTFRRRDTSIDTSSGRFEGDRESDASEYRFRLGILPEHQWSGELVATQFLQDIDSTFVPRRTLQRRDARLALFRRSRVWPLRFEIGRNRAQGLEGDPRDESRERFLTHLDHLGRHSTARIEAEVLDLVEDFSRQDYRLVRLAANNNWRVGSSRKLVLSSSLYAFDRSGTSDFRNLQAGQGVDWRPRETVLLSAEAEYREQEDPLGTQATRRLLADFEHTLWGSLVTRLSAQVQRVELPAEGTEDLDQLELAFDYSRHLRPGILTLRWSGRRRLDDDDLPGEQSIRREEQVFEPGFPILLEAPGVLLSTVVVTDVNGEPFILGFDYDLVMVGALTAIRVLANGSILPGETLRISYAVETGRRLEVRTDTTRYGGGWRSEWGWWFRLQHGRQSQDLLSGIAAGRIDQTADEEYRVGVDRTRWRLHGNYHDRESEILPYVLRQFGGSWKVLVGRRLDLTLRGRAQRMTFPTRDEETRLELAGLDLRCRVGRLRIDGTLELWNEDNLGRAAEFFEGQLNARWRHRKIEVLGRWRNRRQRVERGGRDARSELTVVVRRFLR